MTLDDLRTSLGNPDPPNGLRPLLLALWHDAKGDWDAAHRIAQDVDDELGAWVHAYLHRQEGDAANAGYWYLRAKKPPAAGTLEDEWAEIAAALLTR
jgi:hypothetical protein